MTEPQETASPTVKWLRYSARALAVTWALSVTFCWLYGVMVPWAFCGASFGETDPAYGLAPWLTAATVVLAPWVATVIAWRRGRAGAVVLLFASVLVPIAHFIPNYLWAYPTWTEQVPMTWTYLSIYLVPLFLGIVPTVVPGLLAALLFLATWRKSRAPAPSPATE